MRTVTEAVTVAEAVKDRVDAGLRQLEEGVEHGVAQGRRVILEGRRAADHAATAAELEIRRHPFRATAFAAFAGAFVGLLAGLAFGTARGGMRSRSSDPDEMC